MEENITTTSAEVETPAAETQTAENVPAEHAEEGTAAPVVEPAETYPDIAPPPAADPPTEDLRDVVLRALAQDQGFEDVGAYMTEVSKFLENKRYAEQAAKLKEGKTLDDLAVEAARLKEKADAFDRQKDSSDRFVREMKEFQQAYPGVRVTPEAGEYYRRGYSFIDAYKLAQFDAQEKERRVQQSNEANAKTTVGSLAGGAAEDAGLTDDQIRSMSPYELAKPSVWARVSAKLFKKK